MVGQHHQYEQHSKADRRHREEVNRHQILDMVIQESLPSLGGWLPVLGHQSRNRALGNLDSQLQQFPVNARHPPEGIGTRHLADQIPDFGTHTGGTAPLSPGNPGPEKAETLPLPAHDRVTVNEVQGLSPMGPDPREHHPKHSVFLLESWDSFPPLQHSQLLSQSQVLQRQLPPLSKSCKNQYSQPSQCLDHGSECGGKAPNNQSLSSRRSFGERVVVEQINPILRGWVNYFAVGDSSECFSFVRDWVEKKARRHLMRARERSGLGWKRWSRQGL